MHEVVCVGILCTDILTKPVDKIPEKGKLGLIDKIEMQIGGCASNTAIDLCKIGIKTAIIGKIGNDGFGKFLQEKLKSEYVDIKSLKIDDLVPTSASVVMIDSSGERSILHCLGTNTKFTYDDIDYETVMNSRLLFIAGVFLMPGFDGSGAERLLKEANEAGIITCADTAWDSTGEWMNKISGMLKYLDWFLPSYDEAVEMSGKTEPSEIADIFINKGVKNVVIKLGKDGCYVKEKNKDGFFVPTYQDIKAIDTSGAGDSFCAGFITGLLKNWDIEKCARFANAVGTQCVMQIGTTTGIKSLKETLEFMKKYKN